MSLLAQMTPEQFKALMEGIDAADSTWMLGVLVTFIIALAGFVAWFLKYYTGESGKREEKLGTRLTAIEEFSRTELVQTISHNTQAFRDLREVMESTHSKTQETLSDLRKELLEHRKQRLNGGDH